MCLALVWGRAGCIALCNVASQHVGPYSGGHHWHRALLLPQHVLDGNCSSSQERQRLETILNLCAEYTKTDGTEPGDVHRLLSGDTDASQWVPRGAMALGHAVEELQQGESLERSDEENLKEECSSTESTHHEVRGQQCCSVTMPCCTVPCQSALSTAREADRTPSQGGAAAGGGACQCPWTPGPAEGPSQGAGAAAAGDITRGEGSGGALLLAALTSQH